MPETIADYRLAIRNFLAAPFLPPNLADLTPLHLDMWCSQLRKAGKTNATRNWYQQNVRVFLRWLYRKRLTAVNFADEIEPVKVLSRNRPQVSSDDMAKVLQVAKGRLTKGGEPGEHHYRDIALLRLLWATGIRRGGIARLRYEDVDMDLREVRLPAAASKTKRPQVVPFDSPTKSALLAYFIHERGRDDGPLFLARSGAALSPSAIHLVLRRLSAKAGVKVRCHGFRRGLVRRARVAGFGLGEAAALVGHSSLEVTRLYSGDGEGEAMIAAYRKLLG